MKKIISRSIDYLINASDKDVFIQISALSRVQDSIREIYNELEYRDNSDFQEKINDIYAISVFVEHGHFSAEVNKYIFECIINRLKQLVI